MNARGFSLVEMLVTIGIVAMLMAITLGVNRTGERQIALFREKSLLVANFNRVKAKSLQTFLLPSRPCGYGINIDTANNRYALFRDDPSAPPDCATADLAYGGTSEDLDEHGYPEVYDLPTGVSIQAAGTTLADIVYIPPQPQIIINGDPLITNADVVLETPDGSSITIRVNNAGQITTL
ncbi:MAG: hypothetical protein A2939_03890 [Parcubacteria group bacterium RIFCSPLOWO2_01_FULL_48_18]|nr:MAG: hypothetical protein A3J67_00955 [Parcubacteria group bacterium RIFCSPHIGHO2_02_FULL_48_10b]OHB22725.1 MAG: hypothetical protein A2939_03890 [Parcubacteria group bacterium RIFCSPLOWO2_01_FULL_48_18]